MSSDFTALVLYGVKLHIPDTWYCEDERLSAYPEYDSIEHYVVDMCRLPPECFDNIPEGINIQHDVGEDGRVFVLTSKKVPAILGEGRGDLSGVWEKEITVPMLIEAQKDILEALKIVTGNPEPEAEFRFFLCCSTF